LPSREYWLHEPTLAQPTAGSVTARTASSRLHHGVQAILFDLGDTLMIEATEVKAATGTTIHAELFDGSVELLMGLRQDGYRLGLVADTRPGTAQNVLHQHGLGDVFEAMSISELVGVEKPDRRIFEHALAELRIPPAIWDRVVMVGNRLDRDVRGANALGLISVWLHLTDRYPTSSDSASDRPTYTVTTVAELRALIHELGGNNRVTH
jgi:putative hydrolase of the HAD superfamily